MRTEDARALDSGERRVPRGGEVWSRPGGRRVYKLLTWKCNVVVGLLYHEDSVMLPHCHS